MLLSEIFSDGGRNPAFFSCSFAAGMCLRFALPRKEQCFRTSQPGSCVANDQRSPGALSKRSFSLIKSSALFVQLDRQIRLAKWVVALISFQIHLMAIHR